MPLQKVICADSKLRRAGIRKEIPLKDCLDCAATRNNGCQFTFELLSSMFEQVQDRAERISTTTLTTKCLRSEYLQRKNGYAAEPEKMWAAFRGTMYHGQLEYLAHPRSVAEARYFVDIPGLGPLSGSPDLVDPPAGRLYDYKMTKEVPRWDTPWPDHVAQLNINRWLVDHATTVEYQGEKFDMADREVEARFRPLHWDSLIVVYMDDKGPKPLTITESVEIPAKNGRTKKVRQPAIWSDEQCMEYITPRYQAAFNALTGNQLPAIPEAFEGLEHPLCGFCPMKRKCLSLLIEGK